MGRNFRVLARATLRAASGRRTAVGPFHPALTVGYSNSLTNLREAKQGDFSVPFTRRLTRANAFSVQIKEVPLTVFFPEESDSFVACQESLVELTFKARMRV